MVTLEFNPDQAQAFGPAWAQYSDLDLAISWTDLFEAKPVHAEWPLVDRPNEERSEDRPC